MGHKDLVKPEVSNFGQVETHRASCSLFVSIIVIEDKVHFVSMAVDAGDAAAKRGDQIVHRGKQHVGQYGPLDMTPP